MGTTPNRALRYPEATTLANTLHTQIKNLATDVDAQLHNVPWFVPPGGLQNGFVNWDANSNVYDKFAICKVNGFVVMRGLLDGGTRSIGTVMFTLPSGFRPGGTATDVLVHTRLGAEAEGSVPGGGRINIKTLSGVVTVNAMSASGWISLSYIMFPAFA